MVTSSALCEEKEGDYAQETAQLGLEVAASHSSLHPLLVSCDLAVVHRRAMQYSPIILRAEEEGMNREMEGGRREGSRGIRTDTLSPCSIFLMLEIESKALHTPSELPTTGLQSQSSWFSIEILPWVLCFVIMECGIALLCLKALSQSVAASWYASLEEDNDFVLWGTGAPFGTLP